EVEGLIGFFANTLALRLELSDGPTVQDLLLQVKARSLSAQMHQDLPFEQVVELVQPARSLSHSPLFQVMFAWQNNEQVDLALPGLTLSSFDAAEHVTAKFDLTLDLSEIDGRIVGALEYASALFDRTTAERFGRYLVQLLQAMAEAGEATPVASLAILPDAERLQVIEGFNATAVDYPAHALVHELFEEQVAKAPDAIAVVYEDDSLTYGELDRRANRLAHHLAKLGIRPDDRVAICVERSIEMVVGLLAILKAGGAYVPLDPAYPPDRLAYMLADSAPVAILTHGPARQMLETAIKANANEADGKKPASLPVIDLIADEDLWADQFHTPPDSRANGLTCQNLAYVIYTSGSTGQPKGVGSTIAGLANRVLWFRQFAGTTPINTALKTSIGFVDSISETLQTLIAGGRLIVFDHATNDIVAFIGELKTSGATCLVVVPSLLRSLLEHDTSALADVRILISSGERLAADLSRQVTKSHPSIRLINLYGSSEVNGDATFFEYSAQADLALIPIGRPIANTRIYILDGRGEPVPVGVAGELHIGGAGVARGYLNRP
ncbi:non-ribosomal peptide synthetase, partial [Rhizobium leguminosarum]|uniref:non-ribosomal peptide synthetase n=1 Tax=Rhizobium leguminosarum TaxID=384 RepID=UPI0010D9006B